MFSNAVYKTLGALFFLLGAIGALVPLLPTTVFWILAALCFSRGAPEWFEWLRAHPKFGPTLVDYLDHKVISVRGKFWAVGGMAAGCLVSFWLAKPPLWVAMGVILVLMLVALWILRHHSQVRR